MKVICTHSKIEFKTGSFYFRKDKIYNVYIKNNTQIINDESDVEWYYKYISNNFMYLSKIRKLKLEKLNGSNLQ